VLQAIHSPEGDHAGVLGEQATFGISKGCWLDPTRTVASKLTLSGLSHQIARDAPSGDQEGPLPFAIHLGVPPAVGDT
jgi:hypothetical protein